MDAIDILVNEHRHIGRVMDVLERAVEQGRGGCFFPGRPQPRSGR